MKTGLRYCITPGCTEVVSILAKSSLCRACEKVGKSAAPDEAVEARTLMVDENGRTVDSARWIMRQMRR